MSKIKVATAFTNTIKNVSKHFKVSEADKETGIKHWRQELDFSVEGKPAGTTNNNVVDANGKPLKVLEFDLSQIERRDAKADDNVSAYEFIQAVVNTCKKRVVRGAIKFILSDDIKQDVIKAVNEKLISKTTNLITEQAVIRQEVKLIPDLDLELNDDEVTGMKDIKKQISNKKKEQAEKEKESIEEKLEA